MDYSQPWHGQKHRWDIMGSLEYQCSARRGDREINLTQPAVGGNTIEPIQRKQGIADTI